MRAYKFRGATQVAFALDTVFNQRLYCAEWDKLNDPMEGMFVYLRRGDGYDYADEVAEMIKHKRRLRVCSLSKTFNCHLLWSHYAEGFSGMAIEVELPDNSPVIKNITYRGVFAHTSLDGSFDASHAADEILSSKYSEWQYEQEVRVLQEDQWYRLDAPVRRVIVGHRMNPALFEGLKIICERKNIIFARTGIGDEGIDADVIWPPS